MPTAPKWSSSSLSETSPLVPSSASIDMSPNTSESSSASRRTVFLGVDVGTGSARAVAVDSDGSPVSVSWTGDARRNIIVWMDHRAVNQAERINANNSPVLQYCGGSLSPEMQAPKISAWKEDCYR
ncbi:hypothetical protein BHE74_00055185 [Ensete ventricosum]|nr:hypothetical protein BHE74_00055185 [Ensete ventricosum]